MPDDLRAQLTEAARDAFASDQAVDGRWLIDTTRHPGRALDDALDAVWAVVEPELDRLRGALAEARSAIRHHAAEAHRRKWRYDGTSPQAFSALDRLGNELLATITGDAEEATDDRP